MPVTREEAQTMLVWFSLRRDDFYKEFEFFEKVAELSTGPTGEIFKDLANTYRIQSRAQAAFAELARRVVSQALETDYEGDGQ